MAKIVSRSVPSGKLDPRILIFDVDGVLVDVRETYWRSGLQTIQQLTGKKPTWAEFHEWKRMPGNNDDWLMVSRWATALGVPTTQYLLFAIFNITAPIMSLLLGFTGFQIQRIKPTTARAQTAPVP